MVGCDPTEEPVNPDIPVGELTELTSPITQNTTLKDLGLPIDYVYKGSGLLEVKNNAVLTIEPGVTIQFTKTGGGIEITNGACINAVGTAEKHIQFVGTAATKGSWGRIDINTNTDNQFVYCDFINAGGDAGKCAVRCWVGENQIGMSHCKISGSAGWGLVVYENTRFTAFDNNVIENCDDVPVWMRGSWKQLEKLDMTSDFTNNPKQYIEVLPNQFHSEDAVINQTSVPYYFSNSCDCLNKKLTINAGVTIYMGTDENLTGSSSVNQGVILINGTAEKPVTFTRLPGTTGYWGSVYFRGLIGSRIENCIFEYGGNHNDGGMIEIASESDLTLTNVVIRNSYNYGVRIDTWGNTYRLTHTNVTFSNNYKGNVYDFRNDQVYNSLNDLP
jgi:hypothetical protein